MKTLALFVHPSIKTARVHRAWQTAMEQASDVSVRCLYSVYPRWKIDTAAEQALLLTHERIAMVFPFYLYSPPPLLKKWMDDVLTFGWAYGPNTDALRGKELVVATSTGGPQEGYHPGGYHNFSVEQLLLPLCQVANLVGMRFMKPFVVHKVRTMTEAEIAASSLELISYLRAPQPFVLPEMRG